MSAILTSLILVGVIFYIVGIHKAYRTIPAIELKRRARSSDKTAGAFYKVAGYGQAVDVLLWFILGVVCSFLFVYMARHFGGVAPLIALAVVIWISFAWAPNVKTSLVAYKLAELSAPVIATLLSWLQPINSRLLLIIKRLHKAYAHTGLYEKEDILSLLSRQHTQIDNRISDAELKIARSALTFADKTISSIMTPRRVIKTVQSSDAVGPHLMDEVHKSGFSRLPVMEVDEDANERIVGTLYAKDLVGRAEGGTVAAVMNKGVYFVNENLSILHALQAFLKTHHHLFIVVNQFEEIVGVVSIEDVLEQVLGVEIVDEFDQFEDLRAVAALQAKQDRKHVHHAVKPPEQTQQSEETVVE